MTIAVDPNPPPQVVCRYIPHVPDENQPPNSGRNNWCVPTAAVNIVDYWDNVMNDPGSIDVMDNWSRAEASDYIGWFMDTGNFGSPNHFNTLDSSGTYNADIVLGLNEFIQWDSSATFGQKPPTASKKSYKWGMAIDYTMGHSLFKSEIDSNRPAILFLK